VELRDALESVSTAVQELASVARKLEVRIQELEEKEAQWQESEKRMGTSSAGDVVCLNVGGQRFTTTESTLMRHRGSYFEEMLLSRPRDGNSLLYFIDRDPRYFGIILNFIREGKVRATDLKSVEIEDLLEEFQFFRIPFNSSLSKKQEAPQPVISQEEVAHRAQGGDPPSAPPEDEDL